MPSFEAHTIKSNSSKLTEFLIIHSQFSIFLQDFPAGFELIKSGSLHGHKSGRGLKTRQIKLEHYFMRQIRLHG